MLQSVKCIGILTSGGDAPGMNAAIRAVTRTAIFNNIEVKGIYRGFKGLVTGDIVPFKTNSVSNIIQRGGTVLKSARCEEFIEAEGRKKAYENLLKHGIDALIVIGGDGTLTGASIFAQEHKDISVVGIPATIDNDLNGTDVTIGYNTALNTIVEAVDKIRDTASSHERLFFIEAMGRNCGALALNSAIAAGAEAAIIPEISVEKDQLHELISQGFRKTKNSSLVLVAESEITGGAIKLAERYTNRVKSWNYDTFKQVLSEMNITTDGKKYTCYDINFVATLKYLIHCNTLNPLNATSKTYIKMALDELNLDSEYAYDHYEELYDRYN